MKRDLAKSLRSFLIEIVVYAGLVTGYYFLVLHFLGDWLHQVFQGERRIYAALSLGLIVGQGILLELLTRSLLRWLKGPTEAE
jgi:hypothetical protein